MTPRARTWTGADGSGSDDWAERTEQALLAAFLPQAASEGWSKAAMIRAGAAIGLSEGDLGEGRAMRGAESSYYVRVYTPSARPQASAPMMGAGAPIPAQTITIVRQAREVETGKRAP